MTLGECLRKDIPRGQQYQLCRSVHAEQNAIISASRRDMIGSDLYLTGKEQNTLEYVENAAPCIICKKLIINAGINRVYVRLTKHTYKEYRVEEWLNETTKEDYLGY